ncbi:hypothetical protein EVAR_92633_1 [Eumeta japonica]|uniref:Uncharacterized protein n=1 Tax=Eumeta variegata TaxID=151549 RepID=A0A4C1SXN1_EUMVA|nr:hypothetical protein EVAR_92633_1 [Eumeta japonica]
MCLWSGVIIVKNHTRSVDQSVDFKLPVTFVNWDVRQRNKCCFRPPQIELLNGGRGIKRIAPADAPRATRNWWFPLPARTPIAGRRRAIVVYECRRRTLIDDITWRHLELQSGSRTLAGACAERRRALTVVEIIRQDTHLSNDFSNRVNLDDLFRTPSLAPDGGCRHRPRRTPVRYYYKPLSTKTPIYVYTFPKGKKPITPWHVSLRYIRAQAARRGRIGNRCAGPGQRAQLKAVGPIADRPQKGRSRISQDKGLRHSNQGQPWTALMKFRGQRTSGVTEGYSRAEN